MDNKNLIKQLRIVSLDALNTIRTVLAVNNKYRTGKLIASLDIRLIQEANAVMMLLTAEPYFKYVDRQSPSAPAKYKDKKTGRYRKLVDGPPINSVGKAVETIMRHRDTLIKQGVTRDLQELIDKIIFQNSKFGSKK